MTVGAIPNIASMFGLSESELFSQAMVTFIQEKKPQVLQTKLEMLARYGVDSVSALEMKIANGDVPEHPSWEDLIVIENLSERLVELDDNLRSLQESAGNG